MKKLILLILFSTIPAFAQNARYDNIAFAQGGRTLSGATVTICSSAGTGTPCAPTVPLCISASDVSCTAPNPFTTDSNGNYGFWIVPGTYFYSITGTGITGFSGYITLATPGISVTIGANNSFTGKNTFAGTTGLNGGGAFVGTFSGSPILTGSPTIATIDRIVSLDGTTYPYTCSGLQAALNAAAAFGAGTVVDARGAPSGITCNTTLSMGVVDLKLGRGTHTSPTLILKGTPGLQLPVGTNNGSCHLEGEGRAGTLGGTTLQEDGETLISYQATSAGIAIDQTEPSSSWQNVNGCLLENLIVDGTSATAGSFGIQTGGTQHFTVRHIEASNFTGTKAAGIHVYNNATSVFTERLYGSDVKVTNNTNGLLLEEGASGTSTDFGDTYFELFCNDFTGQDCLHLISASIPESTFVLRGNVSGSSCTAVHADANSGTSSSVWLDFHTEQDGTCNRFKSDAGGVLNIVGFLGGTSWQANPDSGSVNITACGVTNAVASCQFNMPSQFFSPLTISNTIVPDAAGARDVGTAPSPFGNTWTGSVGGPETSSCPTATVGRDFLCFNTGAHAVQMSNNGGSYSPLVDLASAQTITGAKSFSSGTLLPSAVNGTLNSAALPYGIQYWGTAPTNNFQITPGSTGGVRIVNVLDPSTAITYLDLKNAPVVSSGTNSNVFRVTSDFTSASNTSLQTITGLSWTLPANIAANYSANCHIAYSQATNVSDAFGVQAASLAPTNIFATGEVVINGSTGVTTGVLPTLTTTTATNILTFTPASTSVQKADLYVLIENPSGVANTINIMVSQSTAADVIVVKKDSYCSVN